MKKYEPLDISGDVGLKAFGKTKEEVFINAAEGMYGLITDINLIEEKKTINLTVEGFSLENLLVSWLNELIFQFDAYGFIGKKIEIMSSEFGVQSFGTLNSKLLTLNYALKVQVSGEDFEIERHESRLLIKAATYHKLRIEKVGDNWEAEVIFDI